MDTPYRFLGGELNGNDLLISDETAVYWSPMEVVVGGERRALFEKYVRQTIEPGDGRQVDVFVVCDMPDVEILGAWAASNGAKLSSRH